MEALRNWLTSNLPGLTNRIQVQVVLDELNKVGCSCVDDLVYVNCDDDLGSILLPVEKRKMKDKISAIG